MDRFRKESSSDFKSLRVRSGGMNRIHYGFASITHVATFLLVVRSGWARTAEGNDECGTAPFLKRSECSGSNCDGLLKGKWHKIKCFPFSLSVHRSLCSKWCHEGESSTQSWYGAFQNFSLDRIYCKNGDRQLIFEVVHCRSFEFIVKSMAPEAPGITVVTTQSTHHTTKESSLTDVPNSENNSLGGGVSADKTFISPSILSREKQRFKTFIQGIWSSYSSNDQKLEDTVFAAFIFENFVFSSARKCWNVKNPEFTDVDEDVAFRVRRNVHHREDDFLFNGSNRENFIKIPRTNLDRDSIVLGLEYIHLSESFSNYSADTKGGNKTKILDSVIMSAVIYPPPEVLRENITLVFKNMKVNRRKRTCVFWSFSEENFGSWSSEGCQTKMISDHHTECVCNHLTHFAVLMDFTDNTDDGKFFNQDKTRSTNEHYKLLTLLTRVGMALSLTGVILTIISYLQLTDRSSPLCHIRVGLTSCIGAGHIVFFAGIDSTGNQAACVAVAALMQYFLMASFCWMLVEGIYIYLFVVKVYNITDKMHRYHGFCWGLPAIIVAVSLGIAMGNDGIETFVNDENCWMSSSSNIIWIFLSFVGLIAIINMMILVRVIKELTTIQQVKESQTEQIRLGVRACVVLAPLLGVTWLIGFLVPLHIAFSYIFVILNSTQGFFTFFFHCLGNSEIRGRFKRRILKVLPDAFNQRQGDNGGNSQARQSHNDTGIPVQDRE